ncbi:uncharacterized protein LOC128787522 isoform X4 [Vidua chalybeata]|uniref:uncharacterized protein LOC128787522 isoform X4 n=1 Tax=Vidua chalybeata TaxID=81927 RepID=UPI0023A868B2|nr:uncharacterized protein LOC128787522 isoform X4 [Vidua chalybeata]
MSSRQRKRPGGAIDSRPARKRSRLLPSSAGGTSQTEPRDLEESATPAFEPEVIDLTGEDTIDLTGEDVIELRVEDVIDLTGEEEVIDLTGEDAVDLTGEEEVIDLTGEDVVDLTGEEEVIDLTGEEEVIDLTGEEVIDLTGEEVIDLTGEDVVDLTGESSEPEVIIISDDESPMDREQSQQQLHLSRASAEPLARDDEEEPRDIDGTGSRTSSTHMFPVHQGIQLIYWQVMMKRNQERLMVHGQQVLLVLWLRRMRPQRTGSPHIFSEQQRIQLSYLQGILKRSQEIIKDGQTVYTLLCFRCIFTQGGGICSNSYISSEQC